MHQTKKISSLKSLLNTFKYYLYQKMTLKLSIEYFA